MGRGFGGVFFIGLTLIARLAADEFSRSLYLFIYIIEGTVDVTLPSAKETQFADMVNTNCISCSSPQW